MSYIRSNLTCFLFAIASAWVIIGSRSYAKSSYEIINLETVSKEFKEKGPQSFFNEHQLTDQTFWAAIGRNIETGDESWLKLATKLRRASDAGFSELIDVYLGNALKRNPKGVLQTIRELDHNVCDALIPDDSSSSKEIVELNGRLKALYHLDDNGMDKNLIKAKFTCTKIILRRIHELKVRTHQRP